MLPYCLTSAVSVSAPLQVCSCGRCTTKADSPMRTALMQKWWTPWTQAWGSWSHAWPRTLSTYSWSGVGRRWGHYPFSSRTSADHKMSKRLTVVCFLFCSQKPDDRPTFGLLFHELASLSDAWTNMWFVIFFLYIIFILFIYCNQLLVICKVRLFQSNFISWILHFISFVAL